MCPKQRVNPEILEKGVSSYFLLLFAKLDIQLKFSNMWSFKPYGMASPSESTDPLQSYRTRLQINNLHFR